MKLSKINQLWLNSNYRPYSIIVGLIFLTFTISANIAWLNPNPSYVIKTNERIPIMWQYNGDSTVEFLSAAYFPEYFKTDKTRTNRPGYPFLARAISEVYGFILSPITTLGALAKTMLGYVTLKIVIYLSGALALYHIVRRYLSQKIALLSTALVFLHPFAVTFIATFHTSELQFITPIFTIWMWLNLKDKYSHGKNILFSFITGFLMLAKQNYAVYLAILLFSFFVSKRYKEAILSFIVHLIPLIIWLLTLKTLHIPYYNHESDTYGQGVWLYTELIHKNPVEILKILLLSVQETFLALTHHFSILIIPAMYAITLSETRGVMSKNMIKFILIFAITLWLQTLAANRYNPYMTSDLSVVIMPLVAVGVWEWLKRFGKERFVPILCLAYLLIGLVQMIHFPWIHPYDQKSIVDPNKIK